MTSNSRDRPMLALAWISGSALSFSVMSVFVKHLAPSIPQFEMVFFRSLISTILVLALVLIKRETLIPKSSRFLLVIRGVAGFMGVSCLFYTVSHLPLSIASMVSWSSPIFVLLFSRIFLKERVKRSVYKWIVFAFVGLVLLLNPGHQGEVSQLPLFAIAIGILGSAFAGLAYVAVRAVSQKLSPNTIVLYFAVIALVLSVPLASTGFQVPTLRQGGELGLMGLAATVGQMCMTRAYQFAAAGLVSTMNLTNAAYAALLGWFLFGEFLVPVQWLGMILMAVSIAALALGNFLYPTKTTS